LHVSAAKCDPWNIEFPSCMAIQIVRGDASCLRAFRRNIFKRFVSIKQTDGIGKLFCIACVTTVSVRGDQPSGIRQTQWLF